MALSTRSGNTEFEALPEAGVSTIGQSIRNPDVSVAAIASGHEVDQLVPDPLIVFQVVSSTSGLIGRTVKLHEYRAVPSIRRYVIVDSGGPDVDVFSCGGSREDWVPGSLTKGEESLALPEIGIEVPVDEVFRGVIFDTGET